MSAPARPGQAHVTYGGKDSYFTPPFPGITEPRCWQCTWVFHDGIYQVKYVARLCPHHGRHLGL